MPTSGSRCRSAMSSYRSGSAAFKPRMSSLARRARPSGVPKCKTACQRPQSSEAQRVIRRAEQIGMHLHAAQTPNRRAARSAIGIHPTEDFFDAFAIALAHGAARVARGARIQTRGLATFDHRHVASDLAATQMRDEIFTVVANDGHNCNAFETRQSRHQKHHRLECYNLRSGCCCKKYKHPRR